MCFILDTITDNGQLNITEHFIMADSEHGRCHSVFWVLCKTTSVKVKIVPPYKEVETSRVGGTKLPHPVKKFKASVLVGTNCPTQLENLNFQTWRDKIAPSSQEV